MDDYISKPVRIEQLGAVLAKCVATQPPAPVPTTADRGAAHSTERSS